VFWWFEKDILELVRIFQTIKHQLIKKIILMQFFVSILQDVKPDSGWDHDTLQQGSKDDTDKSQIKKKTFVNE